MPPFSSHMGSGCQAHTAMKGVGTSGAQFLQLSSDSEKRSKEVLRCARKGRGVLALETERTGKVPLRLRLRAWGWGGGNSPGKGLDRDQLAALRPRGPSKVRRRDAAHGGGAGPCPALSTSVGFALPSK